MTERFLPRGTSGLVERQPGVERFPSSALRADETPAQGHGGTLGVLAVVVSEGGLGTKLHAASPGPTSGYGYLDLDPCAPLPSRVV